MDVFWTILLFYLETFPHKNNKHDSADMILFFFYCIKFCKLSQIQF